METVEEAPDPPAPPLPTLLGGPGQETRKFSSVSISPTGNGLEAPQGGKCHHL